MKNPYIDYLWEKLYEITSGLCERTSSLQNEINNLYTSQIFQNLMAEMTEKQDIKEIVKKLDEIVSSNNQFKISEICDLIEKNNWGKSLSDEDAVKIAKSILTYYTYVSQLECISVKDFIENY